MFSSAGATTLEMRDAAVRMRGARFGAMAATSVGNGGKRGRRARLGRQKLATKVGIPGYLGIVVQYVVLG